MIAISRHLPTNLPTNLPSDLPSDLPPSHTFSSISHADDLHLHPGLFLLFIVVTIMVVLSNEFVMQCGECCMVRVRRCLACLPSRRASQADAEATLPTTLRRTGSSPSFEPNRRTESEDDETRQAREERLFDLTALNAANEALMLKVVLKQVRAALQRNLMTGPCARWPCTGGGAECAAWSVRRTSFAHYRFAWSAARCGAQGDQGGVQIAAHRAIR